MAVYEFGSLQNKYDGFLNPVAEILANKKNFSSNSGDFIVSDVSVELTCGCEASIAEFSVYNCFDRETGSFTTKGLTDYIALGTQITIQAGYENELAEIFVGFVSKVNFVYNDRSIPHIEVLCMDIKGVMMSGSHECQLTANNFGDAIGELFKKSSYEKMKSKGIYRELKVTATPDKKSRGEGESDITIEMTGESDYEFAVKAARRFNYEFFTDCGSVLFRKARQPETTLMVLSTTKGILELSVEYDIVGLVEKIEVRGTDYGKAELITAKKKLTNTISTANKAKQIIQGSEKIVTDASVKSAGDADYRLESAVEKITYGFGRLYCKCVGMPELKPGNFVEIENMGEPVANRFYLEQVRHTIDDEEGFVTELMGKTDKIK